MLGLLIRIQGYVHENGKMLLQGYRRPPLAQLSASALIAAVVAAVTAAINPGQGYAMHRVKSKGSRCIRDPMYLHVSCGIFWLDRVTFVGRDVGKKY
jgi:hypothetical protein